MGGGFTFHAQCSTESQTKGSCMRLYLAQKLQMQKEKSKSESDAGNSFGEGTRVKQQNVAMEAIRAEIGTGRAVGATMVCFSLGLLSALCCLESDKVFWFVATGMMLPHLQVKPLQVHCVLLGVEEWTANSLFPNTCSNHLKVLHVRA